jgi:hypothetical protein
VKAFLSVPCSVICILYRRVFHIVYFVLSTVYLLFSSPSSAVALAYRKDFFYSLLFYVYEVSRFFGGFCACVLGGLQCLVLCVTQPLCFCVSDTSRTPYR